jgi:hypothetical protein
MTQAKSNWTPPRCLSRSMTAFHSLSPSLSERLGSPNWILVAPDMGLAVKVWDDGTWLWEHSSGATEARGHASDEHTAAQAAESAVVARASKVMASQIPATTFPIPMPGTKKVFEGRKR